MLRAYQFIPDNVLTMLPVLKSGESSISERLLDASGWVCRLWRLRDCSSAVVWMSTALGSVSQQRRGEEPGLTSSAWGCKSLLFMFWGKKQTFSEQLRKTNTVHRCPSSPYWDLLCSAQLCFSVSGFPSQTCQLLYGSGHRLHALYFAHLSIIELFNLGISCYVYSMWVSLLFAFDSKG